MIYSNVPSILAIDGVSMIPAIKKGGKSKKHKKDTNLQKLLISEDPEVLLKAGDLKPILLIKDGKDRSEWEDVFIVVTKDQLEEYIKDYDQLVPYGRTYAINGDKSPKFHLHLILRQWTFVTTKDSRVDYLLGYGECLLGYHPFMLEIPIPKDVSKEVGSLIFTSSWGPFEEYVPLMEVKNTYSILRVKDNGTMGPCGSLSQKEREWEWSHIRHIFETSNTTDVVFKANYEKRVVPIPGGQNIIFGTTKDFKTFSGPVSKLVIIGPSMHQKYISGTFEEVEAYLLSPYIGENKRTYIWFGMDKIHTIYYHQRLKGWTLSRSKFVDFYLYNETSGIKSDYTQKAKLMNSVRYLDITKKELLYGMLKKIGKEGYMCYEYDMPSILKKHRDGEPLGIEFPVITKITTQGQSFGGKGIDVLGSLEDFEKWVEETDRTPYVMCQYINDPLLLYPSTEPSKGYKFHFRVYMVVSSWGTRKLFPIYKVLTAKSPYIQGDYKNKDIHDTHFKSTSADYYIEDLYREEDQEKRALIRKQIEDIYDALVILVDGAITPWPEAKAAYEILGVDFMVDMKDRVYMLEVNQNAACCAVEQQTTFTRTFLDMEFKIIEEGLNTQESKK